MGVTLRCKKMCDGLDLPFSGFMRLRCRVAMLNGEPFASHYEALLNHKRRIGGADPFYDEFDARTEAMILKGQVSNAIADFCLQPDCGGTISDEACKQISEIVANQTDNENYGYGANPIRFSDFVSILQECVDNESDLIWE